MTTDIPRVRVTRRDMAQAARDIGSLALHLAAALALIVALEPVLRMQPALTAHGMAETRGIGLAIALIAAVLIWTAPGFLPRRHR